MLDDLAGMANSPEDFLENALPELASHNVTVVEVLDVGPKAPSLSIVERVRLIAGRGPQATSEDSFIHLLVTFQGG